VPFAGSAASTTSYSSCFSRGFPAAWTLTASGACISPIVMTAPVATAPATGAGSATTSIQFGAACSISGMDGTYQYAGGTATLICTPYGTTTAVTAPSTAASTRSCAEDGFPATWTRVATGNCVAPVVFTAPVATAPASGGSISPGMSCSVGGYPGTYQYSGGASLMCVASTIAPVATAPVATTPSTVAPATGPATAPPTSGG
jgi:hypothetical protein